MVEDWLKKGGDGILNDGDSTGWLFGKDKDDLHFIVSILHDAFNLSSSSSSFLKCSIKLFIGSTEVSLCSPATKNGI